MPPVRREFYVPDGSLLTEKVRARFEKFCELEPMSGCVLWMSARNRGYGLFWLAGRSSYAHRVAWLLSGQDLPVDRELDHLCRVRCCVNPAHLRVVTQAENRHAPGSQAFAAINRRKTHCDRGHTLAGKNLYVYRNGRHCRSCIRIRIRAYKARLREARRA